MAFTWAQIRDYYLGVCGRTTEAVAEAYDHLTASYRRLASLAEVEELYQDDARVTVPDGADFVAIDCDVYAIHFVVNLTHGHKVTPEEGGMRGRSRYLEAATGKPPLGIVSHYARAGGRLYLRDAARGAQELKLQYKVHPPDVSPEALASHPLTPPHLDWALVWFAASNYLGAHPEQERLPGPEGGPTVTASSLDTRAMALLAEPKSPKDRESADRKEWVRQRGYCFNLSGR